MGIQKVRLDLVGLRFGELTVLGFSHTNKSKKSMWRCRCSCGNEVVVAGSHLMNGHTKSCGCYKREVSGDRIRTHGMRRTRLYCIWLNMKSRCSIATVPCFRHYGGRGITVCEEWNNDFLAFYSWAMSQGYADNLSIDRIDVNGNYCPENCRWVTHKEQTNNTRSNVYLTFNEETHTLKEWSEIVGVNYYTIYSRNKAGKTPAEVLYKGKLQSARSGENVVL